MFTVLATPSPFAAKLMLARETPGRHNLAQISLCGTNSSLAERSVR
jgi:hypothetical protein